MVLYNKFKYIHKVPYISILAKKEKEPINLFRVETSKRAIIWTIKEIKTNYKIILIIEMMRGHLQSMTLR